MDPRPYQVQRFTALLTLPLMMAAAAIWIHFAPPVKRADLPRLNMALPAELGDFYSSLILNCQNDRCRQSFSVKNADDLIACPDCGGAILPMALSERDVLPPDTTIARRLYKAPGTPTYTVTIVLAGADPRSIHRPQQCLPAQGYSIDRQSRRQMPVGSGDPLDLMVIDARRGTGPAGRFSFAYWFVSPDHVTASHYVRLFWTMRDQLFFNRTSRWAYVALTISEPLDTPEAQARLTAFLRLLLPAIQSQTPGRA